jgi:hypothetical protein
MARVMKNLWQDQDRLAAMVERARAEFEEKYTAEKNYEILMNIYEKAMEHRRKTCRMSNVENKSEKTS